ncbi:MAG: hypothetical protein KAH72_09055 [Flavobacteriaceae bacterium]|nr:hypothetical protein [Flavobacteriaceae bacterium]
MINIKDPEILHKIIEFQSCIIEGRNIKGLLRQNIDFFLEKSQVDIITIYMHAHGNVNPEYILSKDRKFEHILKKYIFDKKSFRWKKFVDNCNKHFTSGINHEIITELYEIFKGFMRKKDVDSFAKEMKIQHSVIMPIYNFDNKDIIGYTCFVSQSEREIDMEKVRSIKNTFETLLRPLYDKEYNTIYSKCIRVDESLDFLTTQEKKIMKKVLTGMPYVEIAETLCISINTLKTHMKNIFNKYGVTSKVELFNKAHIRLK